MEFIIVGLVVAAASLLLGRALYRSVSDNRPTCACGQVDCPLAHDCDDATHHDGDDRPAGCPLASLETEDARSAPAPRSIS